MWCSSHDLSNVCGRSSDRDGFLVGRLPAPGARTIAALHHALLVDRGDDVAIACEERLGGAHFRAERQLAFGKTVAAIFLVFDGREIFFRAAGAIGALVHLAARTEVADLRILRR